MPSLDQLTVTRPAEASAQLLQGVLTTYRGEPYLRVNGSAALWGPLKGAGDYLEGDTVLAAVSHTGDYWVVAPELKSGGTEPGTGDLNYVHTQGSPDDTWTVVHGLGKYPAVDVVDTGGSVVIPTVLYEDSNTVTLLFGSPTTGKAFVN